MRELHCETSARKSSIVYPAQAAVVTYRGNLSDVEQRIATIRFQHHPTTAMCRFVDVRKSPSIYRTFTDEGDLFWAEATTAQ